MPDNSERLPLHYLLSNPGITAASLKIVNSVSGSKSYRVPDAWGSTPLHLMCWNPGLNYKLLKTALKAGTTSHPLIDANLHYQLQAPKMALCPPNPKP
jgi:hypothetical protein